MLKHFQSQPWKLFVSARLLAELHAQLHKHKAPPELPTQKDWFRSRLARWRAATGASELAGAEDEKELAELPEGETICHGDFHPENVLLTNGGPIIIDWDSATRGHPLGDVACTSFLFQKAKLPAWTPFHMHLLLKICRKLLHETYLKHYVKMCPGTRGAIEQFTKPLLKMHVLEPLRT